MTLAQEALEIAAEVFTDPDMVGIVSLAAIRLSTVGTFNPDTLSAEVGHTDLPCRAMLDHHEERRQGALAIDPRAEVWLLQGVPATLSQGIYQSGDALSEEQFEPGEGHVLVVAEPNGPDLFEHSGTAYQGRARPIVSAEDLAAGTGALWSVVARP